MLVLTRKVNEWIQIGDDIRITVARVEHGRVRLGIVAPRSISIERADARRLPLGEVSWDYSQGSSPSPEAEIEIARSEPGL